MNTDNDNRLPEENDILLEEYKILVDLLKHQHVRADDYFKTFLTANSIFAGAVTLGMRSPGATNSRCVLIALCVSGVIVSIVWFLVLERITYDTKLRFFQLRLIEGRLGRTDGLFTEGYNLFFEEKTLCSPYRKDEIKPPKGMTRFRVIWAGRVLPLLFICLYVVLMFILINPILSHFLVKLLYLGDIEQFYH